MTEGSPIAFADIMAVVHTEPLPWQSTDLLEFNGQQVRVRTMIDVEAKWHRHVDSDELFLFSMASWRLTSGNKADLR
jgi:hypothetical protein